MKAGLQQALSEAVADLPRLLLKKLLERKLEEADLKPTRKRVRILTDALMSGKCEQIELDSDDDREVVISFTDDDAKELDKSARKFVEDELPKIVKRLPQQLARSIIKTLKATWPEHKAWEQQTHQGFQDRLADRWGEAFDLLGMLLTISREIGEDFHRRRRRSRARRNRHRTEVLARLHARACQVTGEIILLMQAGFADGAMARWRTLHEIAIVATLVAEHGDELAECYLAHDVVESRRALEMYKTTYKDLGYRPPPKREAKRTERIYQSVLQKYGNSFKNQYGWAAKHLGKANPNFADLEEAAQRSHMRSHYKMASQNVHAGVKGITDQFGMLPDSPAILAGVSNAGLDEPGQNAAITLNQITFLLLGPRIQLDELVTMRILVDIQKQTIDAFARAGRKLEREVKRRQAAK